MDIVLVLDFPANEANTVIKEFLDPGINGTFVKRLQTSVLEVHSSERIPCNLDGEPYQADNIIFSIAEKAVEVVLPPDCPCI